MKEWISFFILFSGSFVSTEEPSNLSEQQKKELRSWTSKGFNVTAMRELKVPQSSGSNFEVTPGVVVIGDFKNAEMFPWRSNATVDEELRKMAQTFSQCKVKTNNITIIKIALPAKYYEIDAEEREAIVRSIPTTRRPLIFFCGTVVSIENGTEESVHGLAFRRAISSGPIADTIWISGSGIKRDEGIKRDPLTTAHEMAHVLVNSGHDGDANNILHEAPRNDYLSREQCQRILEHPAVQVR